MIEKKIARFIGVGMGLTMSVIMSIVGSTMGIMEARAKAANIENLPPFVVMLLPSLLVSLVVTSVIAVSLSFFIPMKTISEGIEKSTKAKGIGLRIMQAFASDILYTPLISLVMAFVSTIFFSKVPASHVIPAALGSFIKSFPIEFVLALVAILLIEPVLKKTAVKKYVPRRGEQDN